MAFAHFFCRIVNLFLINVLETFIFREISFFCDELYFPTICHLSFKKFLFLKSCKNLLLLATIHLGIVLMNLAKGIIFRSSRFLSKLHEASEFHKSCLWSFLK